MVSAGHVFVVHSDLTRLAADAVLIPCDRSGHVQAHWGRFRQAAYGPERRRLFSWSSPEHRVTDPVDVDAQTCRYVDTGATPATADLDWLRDGLRQGLDALSRDVTGKAAQHERERPLLALPLAGTGAGGYADNRGAALDVLLQEARAAAEQGPGDVVIVAHNRADYTALQHRRSDTDWTGLTGQQQQAAADLGTKARDGELVLFFGAGVSRSAGLPDFATLLQQLRGDNASDPEDRDETGQPADLPALASQIAQQLGDELPARLAELLPEHHHSVTHALLASLKVPEAITTNFDRLYELAARAPFSGDLHVVPWQHLPGRRPWLLKAHGDVEHGDLVLTAEQYERFQADKGPVASVIQALFLLSRHILVVGYSLRDQNILKLIREVADLLAKNGTENQQFGTVLSLAAQVATEPNPHLPVLSLTEPSDTGIPAAARQLEVFLDLLAWHATRDEASWLLDPTYRSLLSDSERALVESLVRLQVPTEPRWVGLRLALVRLGRRLP